MIRYMYLAGERCCTVCMYKYVCGKYMYKNIYYMTRYMYLEAERCFTVCMYKHVCGKYMYMKMNAI